MHTLLILTLILIAIGVVMFFRRRSSRPSTPYTTGYDESTYPQDYPTQSYTSPQPGYTSNPYAQTAQPPAQSHMGRDIAIGAALGVAADEGIRYLDGSDNTANAAGTPQVDNTTSSDDAFGQAGGDIDPGFSGGDDSSFSGD